MNARSSPLRRTIGLAATVVAAAVVAGCGGSNGSAEQWTDQLCSGILPFVRTATTPPAAGGDPVATTRAISDYLGRTTAALDQATATVDRLGPAPVDGGDTVSTQLRDGLGRIRTAFATSKTQVDALDQTKPETLQTGLQRALTPVSNLGNATGPLAGVTRNPQLSDAAGASASCRELGDVTRAARDARSTPTPGPGRTGQGGGN